MLAKAMKSSLEETILACRLFVACDMRIKYKFDEVGETPDVLLCCC